MCVCSMWCVCLVWSVCVCDVHVVCGVCGVCMHVLCGVLLCECGVCGMCYEVAMYLWGHYDGALGSRPVGAGRNCGGAPWTAAAAPWVLQACSSAYHSIMFDPCWTPPSLPPPQVQYKFVTQTGAMFGAGTDAKVRGQSGGEGGLTRVQREGMEGEGRRGA